jgi:hypothetical protein
MYKIFDQSGVDEFFQRADVPFLLLRHDALEVSCFDDRMPLASLLNAYSGSISIQASDIFLCIPVLDVLGIYPLLDEMSRFLIVQDPIPRNIDFFFAHRSRNNIFRVRVSGPSSETLGLYLKAAPRASADYNAGPLSRARASAQLLQTVTGYCECARPEMPWARQFPRALGLYKANLQGDRPIYPRN